MVLLIEDAHEMEPDSLEVTLDALRTTNTHKTNTCTHTFRAGPHGSVQKNKLRSPGSGMQPLSRRVAVSGARLTLFTLLFNFCDRFDSLTGNLGPDPIGANP